MRCSMFRRAAATAAAMAAMLLVSAAAMAAEPARPERPQPGAKAGAGARPGASAAIRVGQDAPDVELWPLTQATDANGQEIMKIGQTKVKLSDYKHKAPIVIFSSSYT